MLVLICLYRRFADFPVQVVGGGSYTFNITNYKAFIKLHRLINFEMLQFADGVRHAVTKYTKGIITNAPADNSIPVLQLERKLIEINDLITPRIRKAFEEDFGVNLLRLDLSTIEVNKETPEYRELRKVTADLEIEIRKKQNEINIKNLADTQNINAENLGETLRIQREQAERFAALQTQSQFLGAHQINQQASVLTAAAENLGSMGQMNLGGGNGGSGFNPVEVMTGMAIGGAMGGQMAGMMNAVGQNIQQPPTTPPPTPQVVYHVSIDGQSTGPFNLGQLQGLVSSGQLAPSMHVWKPGLSNWDLAGNVAELAPLFSQTVSAPPPPPPPQAR